MRLPCIVLYQPWASLVAILAKPLEFRPWSFMEKTRGVKVRTGDRIAIAAGARKVERVEVLDLINRLGDDSGSTGLDADIASVYLQRVLNAMHVGTLQRICPLSTIVCTATLGEPKLSVDAMPKWKPFINDSDRLEHAKWAWPMLDVKPTEPIKNRGGQGFRWVTI